MPQNSLLKCCSGIIISRILYQEHDAILTLFTQEMGIVKAIMKGANNPRRRHAAQTSPFTEGDFFYTLGREALHKCSEVAPKNMHLALRGRYDSLEAACTMAKALSKSQLPEKPAPALYALFLGYLKNLAEAKAPQALAASFLLKLLRHEGILNFDGSCSICSEKLNRSWYFSQGEAYCQRHAPPCATVFTAEEANILLALAYGRSFTLLRSLELPPLLAKKVDSFFYLHL